MHHAVHGIIGLLFLLFFLVLGVLCLVFWIGMLIHAIQNQRLTGSERVAWVLVIFFLPFIGSLLYCFIGRTAQT